ncbi:hypothetical protein JZX87_03460 [Agrobacterium sp. Ap1]|uniref:hypothetical protein n=1 Tax=Agrobacterium sp. Ap1 TaxID=2815337 RepID=UPI001A8DC375|nr:hypothetical protein [Agrobacterium sp. Ap1]MBO0140224.1 hypothetical protein [Agrobacterium sp. Ap1]
MQKTHTPKLAQNARVSVGEDAVDLIECANKIDDASDFLEGLYMASEAVSHEHRAALKIVIGAAIGCLNEARASLMVAEEAAV